MKNRSACSTLMRETSSMLKPGSVMPSLPGSGRAGGRPLAVTSPASAPIRTAKAAGLRRMPRHVGHDCSLMYCASLCLIQSLSVLSNRRWSVGTTPSKYVPVPPSPRASVPWMRMSRTFFVSFSTGLLYAASKSRQNVRRMRL